jgi:hypothetical protein
MTTGSFVMPRGRGSLAVSRGSLYGGGGGSGVSTWDGIEDKPTIFRETKEANDNFSSEGIIFDSSSTSLNK